MSHLRSYLQLAASCLSAVLLLTAVASASGYTQPFDQTGIAYSSQNDTTGGNGNYATVYDNFTLNFGATISYVQFTGEYFNPPNQGPITGWTIQFWSSNHGQPGSSLFSEYITGTGNEIFLGNFGGFPTYTYTLNLSGFFAQADTEYWLSVVPDLGFPPQWGWSTGTGGDGFAMQDYFGSRSQLPNDMAFTLGGGCWGPYCGPPVPEPTSLALLGSGLFGAAALARKRLRQLVRQRSLLLSLLAAAVCMAALPVADASGFTCRYGYGCLNGDKSFDWSMNYGPPYSTIPNNSIAVPNSWGLDAQVHFAGGGDGERRDQGNGWNGNFAPGDALLWTAGQGPLTFTFSGLWHVAGVGANIQTNFWGPFTALIQAFDFNGNLIDSFSEEGDSNPDGDGSAIFIGILDWIPIKTVEFSITSCTYNCNDFAINQLDVLAPACFGPNCGPPVPEPATLLLLGSGLLGLGAAIRRHMTR